MNYIIQAHSHFRHLILLLIALAFLSSLISVLFKKNFKLVKPLALSSLILTHIQLLLGLILYFTSQKVHWSDFSTMVKTDVYRFFTLEHALGMLAAVLLITIGYRKYKTSQNPLFITIFYGIGLALIIGMIPWKYL